MRTLAARCGSVAQKGIFNGFDSGAGKIDFLLKFSQAIENIDYDPATLFKVVHEMSQHTTCRHESDAVKMVVSKRQPDHHRHPLSRAGWKLCALLGAEVFAETDRSGLATWRQDEDEA